VKIQDRVLAEIYSRLEAGYPDETCGVMLGADGLVDAVAAAKNERTDMPQTRYLIDPLVYAAIERKADHQGRQVLGIYHSHPDAPAEPSATDLAEAWPELSYLIVSVTGGKVAQSLCWRLSETERQFVAEPIEIL